MEQEHTPRRTSAPGAQPSAHDRLAAHFAKRNYELIGELGRGGMGIVYLAKDTKLDRKVALKTLSPDRAARENSLRRFEREARTFAQIRHPHIATLYEFEDSGPLQYLALEYIDGYDLESERRRGKKWPAEEAARIIAAVAGALEYTHSKGILHRDIKPGNILIERSTNRVVLTDFGLAKSRKDETLTASGFAVGTPAYMAPEQISDQFGVKPDGRSDIFSLGTVFYEMLTGNHPFLGADDLKTMRNIVQNIPVPLRDQESSIPEPIEKIMEGMLAKHPDDRFENAKQVESLLTEWIQKKTVSMPKRIASSGATPKPVSARAEATPPAAASAAPLTAPAVPSVPAPQSPQSSPATGGGRTMVIALVLVSLAMLVLGVLIGYWLKHS